MAWLQYVCIICVVACIICFIYIDIAKQRGRVDLLKEKKKITSVNIKCTSCEQGH